MTTPPTISLERTPCATDDARALISELDAELGSHYASAQRHGLSVECVFQPHIAFFLARLDGAAVGCGGVAFEAGFAEVKRMYVRPAARGLGVARAVLAGLEAEALRQGVTDLRLETGDVQHAAIRLYERAGFTRCGPFGSYLALPPEAIARSVFFRKRL